MNKIINYEHLEKKRKKALADFNALEYFTYCNESGIEPENKELYEIGLMESEIDLSKLERIANEKPVVKKAGRKRTVPLSVYREFIDETYKKMIPADAIFEMSYEKRILLEEIMGYRSLVVGKGERIPLKDCATDRIGKVFQKTYYSALKAMQEYIKQ